MRIIAIDGGTTGLRAGLYDDGRLVDEAAGPAGNPAVLGPGGAAAAVSVALQSLRARPHGVGALYAGVSGVMSSDTGSALAGLLAAQGWAEQVVVTSDLYAQLAAQPSAGRALLAVAGTGAGVAARSEEGAYAFKGGRGRLSGDPGSAYAVAEGALRAAARAADDIGPPTWLVEALPAALGVTELRGFMANLERAGKAQIAALAPAVAQCAADGDAVARDCVESQARALASLTHGAAQDIDGQPGDPVYMHGGMFQDPLYRRAFTQRLVDVGLDARQPAVDGHAAVAALARVDRLPPHWGASGGDGRPLLAPTEAAGPEHAPLDRLTAEGLTLRMNDADSAAPSAVRIAAPLLASTVWTAAACLRAGGRLVYLGAGTSGRLGVLDAAECPPTFGVSRDRVTAFIAGGPPALQHSVEGAEDDEGLAVTDLAGLRPKLSPNDIVIGIAASGRTPYVRGGLARARDLGAATALITCNPAAPLDAADTVIPLATGAEVVAGSTRLKAGTATKLALNTISTGAMTLAGFVYEGRMVHMRPVNAKLRRRAVAMVAVLANVDEGRARALLAKADDRIAVAVAMGLKGWTAEEAAENLVQARGNLREALRHA